MQWGKNTSEFLGLKNVGKTWEPHNWTRPGSVNRKNPLNLMMHTWRFRCFPAALPAPTRWCPQCRGPVPALSVSRRPCTPDTGDAAGSYRSLWRQRFAAHLKSGFLSTKRPERYVQLKKEGMSRTAWRKFPRRKKTFFWKVLRAVLSHFFMGNHGPMHARHFYPLEEHTCKAGQEFPVRSLMQPRLPSFW